MTAWENSWKVFRSAAVMTGQLSVATVTPEDDALPRYAALRMGDAA